MKQQKSTLKDIAKASLFVIFAFLFAAWFQPAFTTEKTETVEDYIERRDALVDEQVSAHGWDDDVPEGIIHLVSVDDFR